MVAGTWWWPRPPRVNERRWVMVDVETSGLDAARDRLLAIAGIALRVDWSLRRMAIDLGDSFEVVLRQDEPAGERENILLHGIGVQRQSEGVSPSAALEGFAAWSADSPMLAFHAPFDRTLIGRYARIHLGKNLPNPWLDIEHLCGAIHPEVRARSLDEWMAHFGIRCAARHQAAADTLAECELLLRIWPRVAAECTNWRDVRKLAERHRWIGRV